MSPDPAQQRNEHSLPLNPFPSSLPLKKPNFSSFYLFSLLFLKATVQMAFASRFGGRRQQPLLLQRHMGRHHREPWRINPLPLRLTSSRTAFRVIIITLASIALLPPIFFHFKLRHIHQMQLKKCGWLSDPPLVCAHGGDSAHAFPNTMAAYQLALDSKVDCIEIDVSRSLDGVLFALHDSQGSATDIWKQYFKSWALEHEGACGCRLKD